MHFTRLESNEKMNQNQQDYISYIEDTNRREMANADAYDKALLTLSSVMLGISLTFTENVVSLQNANFIWLLLISWALFTFTIIIVILSFIYGQYQFGQLKEDAKKFFLDGQIELNEKSERARIKI